MVSIHRATARHMAALAKEAFNSKLVSDVFNIQLQSTAKLSNDIVLTVALLY